MTSASADPTQPALGEPGQPPSRAASTGGGTGAAASPRGPAGPRERFPSGPGAGGAALAAAEPRRLREPLAAVGARLTPGRSDQRPCCGSALP